MSSVEFIKSTVLTMRDETIKQLGKRLFDEYISVNYLDAEEMQPKMIAEKICDYIEKVEIATDKSFDRLMERYARALDSLVGDKIEERPKESKTEVVPPVPRAREYYDKACEYRIKDKTIKGSFIDYSRIMLCLYMVIINRDAEVDKIKTFNYSLDSIDLEAIIGAMLLEKVGLLQKHRFEIKDSYESDKITFVILIIAYYCMKDREVVGVY